MLFYKCCRQLLLRMVSPQIVGLVLFCLIGNVLNTKYPGWDGYSNPFENEQSNSHHHPTVRVRNPTTLDVLKQRSSHEDAPPFIPSPPRSIYKVIRDSSIDSVSARHWSNKALPFIPPQTLPNLEASKRHSTEDPLSFISVPPRSILNVTTDSSIHFRRESDTLTSYASSQPLSDVDDSKQRYLNEDNLEFIALPFHSIYKVAFDATIDRGNEGHESDETRSIEHSNPLSSVDLSKRRYWYNDNLPFTTRSPYPFDKVKSYSPIYHTDNRYRYSDEQPLLYSQPRSIDREGNKLTNIHSRNQNRARIDISKREDLYNGSSTRSHFGKKVNNKIGSATKINVNNNSDPFISLQGADIYRTDGHARVYPSKRRKTYNDASTLLSRTTDKVEDHTSLVSSKQGYAYNDTPPLNPTFNAKRYKKPESSAKIVHRGLPLQYKPASSLNASADGDVMTIGESHSSNIEVSGRESTPLLYKTAFTLQAEDELKAEKPTLLLLPKRVDRHWKNLKRLNSDHEKHSRRTDSGLEDSLNILVDSSSKTHVPIVADKVQDNDLLKLWDKFYDKKLKKQSLPINESNYTKPDDKNSTSSQNETSPSFGKASKNTYGMHVFSGNSREIPLSKTRNKTLVLLQNKNRPISTIYNKTRQGRNRNLFKPESTKIQLRNETIPDVLSSKVRNATNLFNYTYHISAMERGSLFPHDPFDDNKDFLKRSLFSSGHSIPLSDNSSIDTSSRKPSVYEVLRPRLRQPPTTDDTREDKLAYLRNNSTSLEKVPHNSHEENRNMSISNRDGTRLLPIVENRTEKIDSVNDLSKRVDDIYSPESLLKSLKNITSLFGRPSSRRIPDSPDSNFPTREFVEARNMSQILKRPRFSPGIRRPSIPAFNTTRTTSTHVFRDTQATTTTSTTNTTQTTAPSVTFEDSNTMSIKFSDAPTTVVDDPTTVVGEPTPTVAETTTKFPESELNRRPKMSDKTNSENDFKRPALSSKTFYDYLMKAAERNASYNFSLPEFRPGNFYRYDGIYPRKPVLDSAYSRPTPFFKVRITPKAAVTEIPEETPTTFESKRTSIRVSSTFYPNRMQDVTMRFHPLPTTPLPPSADDDDDPDEFRDPLVAGGNFSMEKLAYLLIGTCCGLSVLCLCVVVVAIKCRRRLVEKRIKAHFRSRMYPHHDPRTIKEDPWLHQQMYDHFLYANNAGLHPDSSRSSANSCNCHCVTWSLGARNLETSSRPTPSTNRSSSLYLCGQKKLPFGAASTLRFESMLGRKRPTMNQPPPDSSSPESDSLEHDSSESSECPKRCTCISYSLWPMPGDVRRGMYNMCPGHYVAGDCAHQQQQQQQHEDDGEPIPRDCPPPVTGSNYLDRSEGVVFWSSNDERLI